MKIAISAESTIDLTQDIIDKYSINIVPFHITLGDKEYEDDKITTDEIIEFVNQNKILPKTSAVNEDQFDKAFSKLLKTNDAIIHFSLSSDMSSAYDNACKAAKKLKNVYVIDTKSLST